MSTRNCVKIDTNKSWVNQINLAIKNGARGSVILFQSLVVTMLHFSATASYISVTMTDVSTVAIYISITITHVATATIIYIPTQTSNFINLL